MKIQNLILGLLLAFACVTAHGQRHDILAAGTVIPISFTHRICSNWNDQVRAYVAKDIYGDSGRLVIRGGETVAISIKKKKARSWGRAGSIEVTALSVTSVDGQEIMLNGSDYVVGDSKPEQTILIAVGGFFLVPFFGVFFGALVKGQDVCIEQIPVVRVTNSLEIRVK